MGNATTLIGVDEIVQQQVAQERQRLERQAGIGNQTAEQFKRPVELDFKRSQREHTTLLFGGLTWKHEQLIQGALEGLGYKAQPLPTPDVKAFQTGKEYGNNGQCNPTYFTVGNLVQYLQGLEEQGLSKRQIIDRYVFFTAGACGPCRFGMYEAEYRLALRNSGFDGFRVMIFQQSGGLSQSEAEAGPGDEPRFLPRHPQRHELRRRAQRSSVQHTPLRSEPGRNRRAPGRGHGLLREAAPQAASPGRLGEQPARWLRRASPARPNTWASS